MKISLNSQRKGFTLIEVLIVVAIIGVLSMIGANAFKKTSESENLNQQSAVALGMVEEARNNALASLNDSEYGIRFASTSVTLFRGKVYSVSSSNKIYTYTNGVYSAPISIVGGNDIYFNRISGEPSATGTITFKTSTNGALSKIMTISGTGIIQIN